MAKNRGEMTATIGINGDIDPSLQRAVERATELMKNLSEETLDSANAATKLSQEITAERKTLQQALRRYQDFVVAGEENTDQAEELAVAIQDLSKKLNADKAAFAAAKAAADNLVETLDDTEKAAKDAGDGFTIMKGAISDLVSDGIQWLISSATNAVSSILGLAESTREYREDMGKLQTAWESVGKSGEDATEIYKQFYSVLGEEDRSVEAVNHLARFVDTEEDLAKWTDIATGVWGTFGDSLPIEGLTEAANETAKVGDVTGVLADALNWAGVNEDDFQAKLDSLSTEQERAALITETLNGLYSDAADEYREQNKSIIEARYATSDYTDSMAEMGERIEPVTNGITRGLNSIVQKALELTDGVDWEGLGLTAERVLGGIGEALEFAAENADILIPLISGLTSATLAYAIANKKVGDSTLYAVAAEKAHNIAIGISTGTITAQTVATQAATAANALFSSSFLPIAAGIGLAVAAGVYLYKNWDTVVEKAKNAKDTLIETFKALGGFIKSSVETIVGLLTKPIETVQNLIDTVKNGIASITSDEGFERVNAAATKVSGMLPTYATGGFTSGPSIAGEAGREAVISFDPLYRRENIGYWAKAGEMLGARADDLSFSLSGETSGGGQTIDFGGVTFAPQINVSGNADQRDIMAAIEAEYPEFVDLLERWVEDRRRTVYA